MKKFKKGDIVRLNPNTLEKEVMKQYPQQIPYLLAGTWTVTNVYNTPDLRHRSIELDTIVPNTDDGIVWRYFQPGELMDGKVIKFNEQLEEIVNEDR